MDARFLEDESTEPIYDSAENKWRDALQRVPMSEDDIRELLYVEAALQDEIAKLSRSPALAKTLYTIQNAVTAVIRRHPEEVEAHYARLRPEAVFVPG